MAQTITAIGGESLCGGAVVSEVEAECDEVETVVLLFDEIVVVIFLPVGVLVGLKLKSVGLSMALLFVPNGFSGARLGKSGTELELLEVVTFECTVGMSWRFTTLTEAIM